jgi:amino acid permease
MRQIGVRDAVTMMVRGNLGPGMLALPYAFGQAGWLAGTVVMALTILQGMYSMQVLVTCERLLVADLAAQADEDTSRRAAGARTPERLTLGEVVNLSLGQRGSTLIELVLFIAQAGVCCIYISLVTENLLQLVPAASRPSMTLALLTLAPVLFGGMGLVKGVAELRSIAMVGNTGMVLVTIVCAVSGFAALFWPDTALGPSGDTAAYVGHAGPVTGFRDLVMLTSSTFYAFEGMGLVLPVSNAMVEPERFGESLRIASLILGTCYALTGLSCGVAFRSEGLGPGSVTAFLASHARERGASGTIVAAYDGLNALVALVVYLTFSLQLLPAAQVLSRWCTSCSCCSDGGGTAPTDEMRPLTRESSAPTTTGEDVKLAVDDKCIDDDQSLRFSESDAVPKSERKCDVQRTTQRLSLVAACIALTVAVPQVGLLVGLFGSVAWTVLAATPPLCRLMLLRSAGVLRCGARVAFDVWFICFCAFITVVGTTLAMQDIVSSWQL